MILQPDHVHSYTPPKVKKRNREAQQQNRKVLQILQGLREKSDQRLPQKGIKEIEQKRKFYQKKVYLSYCDSASDYLAHLLDRNPVQTKNHVSMLLNEKDKHISRAINNQTYEVKFKQPSPNLKKIKNQLTDKIYEIKNGLDSLENLDQKDRQAKQQQLYENYMEFRKPGYWNENNHKSQQVKQFLKRMNQIKYRLKKKYDSDLKKRDQVGKKHQEQLKREQEKLKKEYIQKSLQKQKKNHEQRQKYFKQKSTKGQQVKKFLQKYKSDKPLYVVKQQIFRKQYLEPIQQQRKKKLNDLRSQRKPLDPQELDEHLRKYEQFKQSLKEVQLKRQEEHEIFERNEAQLKQLYHGHFHELFEQQFQNYSVVQGKRFREKIKQYNNEVMQNKKPKIDPKKRQQLQQLIKQLKIQQNKKIRKKVKSDGTVILQQTADYNPRQIGNSYLNFLRDYNEGKPRKNPQDRSSSMMQLSKKPVIDYLRQNRASRGRSTLSGWRKVLDKSSMTAKDKYDSVMGKVNIMESQARQKQLQLRNMKNKDKALEIKQQLDKYYLESVAAKMVVLKDVILKQ